MNNHLIGYAAMNNMLHNYHFTAFMYAPFGGINLLGWAKNLVDKSSGFAPGRLAASTYTALDHHIKQLFVEEIDTATCIHRYRIANCDTHSCVLVSMSEVFMKGEMTVWHFELSLSIQQYTPRTCQLHFGVKFGLARAAAPAPPFDCLAPTLASHFEAETARLAEIIEKHALTSA